VFLLISRRPFLSYRLYPSHLDEHEVILFSCNGRTRVSGILIFLKNRFLYYHISEHYKVKS